MKNFPIINNSKTIPKSIEESKTKELNLENLKKNEDLVLRLPESSKELIKSAKEQNFSENQILEKLSDNESKLKEKDKKENFNDIPNNLKEEKNESTSDDKLNSNIQENQNISDSVISSNLLTNSDNSTSKKNNNPKSPEIFEKNISNSEEKIPNLIIKNSSFKKENNKNFKDLKTKKSDSERIPIKNDNKTNKNKNFSTLFNNKDSSKNEDIQKSVFGNFENFPSLSNDAVKSLKLNDNFKEEDDEGFDIKGLTKSTFNNSPVFNSNFANSDSGLFNIFPTPQNESSENVNFKRTVGNSNKSSSSTLIIRRSSKDDPKNLKTLVIQKTSGDELDQLQAEELSKFLNNSLSFNKPSNNQTQQPKNKRSSGEDGIGGQSGEIFN